MICLRCAVHRMADPAAPICKRCEADRKYDGMAEVRVSLTAHMTQLREAEGEDPELRMLPVRNNAQRPCPTDGAMTGQSPRYQEQRCRRERAKHGR